MVVIKGVAGNSYWQPLQLSEIEKQIFNAIRLQLAGARDYVGIVSASFDLLVIRLVKFLGLRMDMTRGRASYLAAYEKGAAPVEAKLQDDLCENLRSASAAEPEKANIAGGRADIYLPYSGFRFVIECKREFKGWSDEVIAAYLTQTQAYQQTDVRLGVLAVLDLSVRAPGVPHFTDCFTVRQVSLAPGDFRRVVIMRVPGNRQLPNSASNKPNKRSGQKRGS